MHRASTLIIFFILMPAILAFLILPSIGVLELPGSEGYANRYLLLFYLPAALAALTLPFLPEGDAVQVIAPRSSWPLYSLLALSVLYLVISIADLVIYHQVFTTGISGAWKASTDAGARNSVQGAFALVLGGAPTVLVTLALFNDGSWGDRRLIAGLALVIFVLSLGCMFALSARNSVAISITYVLLMAIMRAYVGRQSFWKWVRDTPKIFTASLFASLIIVTVVVLWLFVDRAVLTRGTVDDAIQSFLIDYKAKLGVGVPDNDYIKPAFYALMMFEFYLTHAASYFSQYLSTGYCPSGGGAYSFYGLYRIIDFVFGSHFIASASEGMIIPGVYLSLPGFLFLDYCESGVLAGWLIVIATTVILVLFFKSSPSLIFVACYMLCLFVFAPFYALLSTGNGFSLLILSLLASLSGAIGRPRRTQ